MTGQGDLLGDLGAWIDGLKPAEVSHFSHETEQRWESQVVERKDFPTFPTFPTNPEGSQKPEPIDQPPRACAPVHAHAPARCIDSGGKSGKVGNIENTDTYGWEEGGKNPRKVGKVGNPDFVSTYTDDDWHAAFDERAGIREFLGGFDRQTAERLAAEDMALMEITGC